MSDKSDVLRREVLVALEELRQVESELGRGETSVAHQRVKATMARLQQLIRDEERD
ncbi:MAG TPA: hypothetical protein VM493_07265 [Vicinamibacterales bacterium]|jgi:hypothetical protein|nr:hypothetical protein [Vicinamibacterales bacterium]